MARPTSLHEARQPSAKPATSARPLDGKLRIGLLSLSGRGELTVKPVSAGPVLDAATGRKLGRVMAGKPVQVTAEFPTGTVRLQGPGVSVRAPALRLAAGRVRIGRRLYPGTLEIRLAGTGVQLVDELDVEQYLEGVLPGELPRHFGLEAQKALAVAARSYALVQRGKHGDFDLCDGTHCQMYIGLVPRAVRGLAAVRATRHLCLWDRDRLAYTFYEADCGGLSTRITDVPLTDKPAEDLPYLRVVRDAPARGEDYCACSPFHHWARALTREALEARLDRRPETYVGQLKEVRITGYDSSGRVTSVELRGEEPVQIASAAMASLALPAPTKIVKTVTGWEFRRSVGARTLQSTRLRMDQPKPGEYRFTGQGNGHGLGLCQIGANGMAAHGRTFRQILAHYYPGTRLKALPGG